MDTLAKFLKCDAGAAAIEYCAILALIGASLVSGLGQVGGELKAIFTDVQSAFALPMRDE